MRSRQRGVHLGFLLLISQLFRVGPSNAPPVTLATLGLNIYLFLVPQKQLLDVCISVQNAYIYKDWTRLIFSPFYHADDWHLYFNMVSLLWKGIKLERRLGSPWFAYIIGVFSLLTGVVYIILEMVLTEFTKDPSYIRTSFVGHLAGIVVGLLYTKGPLKKIMKICAGSGHAQRRPNYGFNIPTGPLTQEEIRQRRLNRFEG
ncbi:Rhomboid-related protein 4 [Acipenser ruthenus]|uniref:Rhomboid-related protein 4 n=1 Tax=Acipenser ruthenus TaxID=7906 RepID=A0A662YP01_ACIRT|nr:Rhomboid-related protein 4 [Acipenser ruthenus]